MIVQFAFHENVKPEPCKDDWMFETYQRLQKGQKLNVSDNQQLLNRLYGVGSQGYGTVYRRGGWQCDFSPYLKRYLVRTIHYGWQEYYSTNQKYLIAVFAATEMEWTEILLAPKNPDND